MSANEVEAASGIAGQNVRRPLAGIPGKLSRRIIHIGVDAAVGQHVDVPSEGLRVVLLRGVGQEGVVQEEITIAVKEEAMTGKPRRGLGGADRCRKEKRHDRYGDEDKSSRHIK